MTEVASINLDNEMDLILSHRRAMKLGELCGLSMPAQTTFATAVSEVARIAISQGKDSCLTLNITASAGNKKDIAAILFDRVDLQKQNPEAFEYARRLMGTLETKQKDGWFSMQINFRIQFGGLITPAKIAGFKEYFENEPPISAYDEIRKKNVQLIQLNDKLTENEKNLQATAHELKLLSTQLEAKVQQRTEKLNDANRQLEVKNTLLNRQNEELASFTYVASHDLQEPLRKIQAFSSRILKEQGNDFAANTKDYFNRLVRATERMQNLIYALLEYSSTNTSERLFVETDLNKTMEEIKSNFAEAIEEKKAVIIFGNLPQLAVIPHQFYQLLSNIISNSLKYGKADTPVRIDISATEVSFSEIQHLSNVNHHRYWKISIADNGIGFEQSYEHKIFELFQRLHGKTEYPGTGIGLAICKKIVQNHEGVITAMGEKDKGAVFNIYLPASTAVINKQS